jgi:hypothetical protein
MANPEHVEIAKRGADVIYQWRREHPGERASASRARLRRVPEAS